MAPYFIVFTVLTCLAAAEARSPKWRFGVLSATIIALFSGLRFETGHDWLAYEAHFRALPSLVGLLSEGVPPYSYSIEPLYIALNILVKTFYDDVHGVFFVASLLSVSLTHFVLSKIAPTRTALVWLMYFGLLFLPAQMTLVRQSLAGSIAMVGLYYATQNRPLRASALAAVSAGFQYSTLALSPLIFLTRWRLDWRIAAALIIIGTALLATEFRLYSHTFRFVAMFTPEYVAAKLNYYAGLDSGGASLTAKALIAAHIVILAALYRYATGSDRIVNVAIWLTTGVVCLQLFFSGFPSLWYRMMIIATPWAVAALFRLERFNNLPLPVSLGAVALTGVAAAGTLLYVLRAPASEPLVPYHSLIHVLAGDQGNGKERAIQSWMRDYPDKEAIERALEQYERLGVYLERVPPER